MQVEEFLERSVQRTPNKTALVCGEQRWSYLDLERESNRLAHALQACGVRRGDRVAIYVDNSPEAAVALFASLKAGGVFMMVNPSVKGEKLTYLLNNSRATAVILPARKIASLQSVWDQSPSVQCILGVGDDLDEAYHSQSRLSQSRFHAWNQLREQFATATTIPPKTCIDVDLAGLIYTSGSTGNPKGVMLTHLNIVSAATSITTYLESREEDIVLNVLPMSFDYGLYQLLMTIKVGGTLVLERSFTYPHAILPLIAREKVTGFPLVPTMAALLLQMDLSAYDFSTIRYLTNTAAALPSEHITRLRQLFPQSRLYSMYGLTECKRVSYLPPEELDRRPNSVGRGMPNEEVYIVDDAGQRVGPGVVGELMVRGANVMKGYWEAPEETAKRLKPGPWPGEFVLATGDLFRMDDEGFLYFVSRKDDIIKTRGEKVSPREVENVLYTHPAVGEVAVVGLPDPILGQRIKAVVSLKPGMTSTPLVLMRHCRQHLEDFMVPQEIELCEELPKTDTGKIDKKPLKLVGA